MPQPIMGLKYIASSVSVMTSKFWEIVQHITLRYIDIFSNLLATGGFSPRLWRVIRDESFSMAVSYEDDGKSCNCPLVTTLLPLSKRTSDDVLYKNP